MNFVLSHFSSLCIYVKLKTESFAWMFFSGAVLGFFVNPCYSAPINQTCSTVIQGSMVESYFKSLQAKLKNSLPVVGADEKGGLSEALQRLSSFDFELSGLELSHSYIREFSQKNAMYLHKYFGSKILYPSAGFDADTPFLLFPGASLVVAVDDHPFVNESAKSVTPAVLESKNTQYIPFRQVDKSEHQMADVILWRLGRAFSGIRIHGVRAYTQSVGRKVYTHGWIAFDTGEGTRVRNYVHIQTTHRDQLHSLEGLEWVEATQKWMRFDILVKGSMDFFSPVMMLDSYSPARKLVPHALRYSGSILDLDMSLGISQFAKSRGISEIALEGNPLIGYGKGSSRILKIR